MTGNTYHIVKHLFKTDALENVPLQQLENIATQYPFFSVGNYLFAKKLHTNQEAAFSEQSKKTALFFSNPYWMQWLLENSKDEKTAELKSYSSDEFKKIPSLHLETVSSANKKEIATTTNEKIIPQEEELVFEPYHTVDYFASQGITLPVEPKSDDKFGKQLKSFTEWLKVMKKFPQKNVNQELGRKEQAAIEGFAEHSLQEKEVVTEAMAEVLTKQGKNEDAVALYRKLSLTNPSKSAYFAAKIEQLKH